MFWSRATVGGSAVCGRSAFLLFNSIIPDRYWRLLQRIYAPLVYKVDALGSTERRLIGDHSTQPEATAMYPQVQRSSTSMPKIGSSIIWESAPIVEEPLVALPKIADDERMKDHRCGEMFALHFAWSPLEHLGISGSQQGGTVLKGSRIYCSKRLSNYNHHTAKMWLISVP